MKNPANRVPIGMRAQVVMCVPRVYCFFVLSNMLVAMVCTLHHFIHLQLV
jgi:hypothetical protein